MKRFFIQYAIVATIAVAALMVLSVSSEHPWVLGSVVVVVLVMVYAWGFFTMWDWAVARGWSPVVCVAVAILGFFWAPVILASRLRSPVPHEPSTKRERG